jgi:Icc protein
MRALWVTDIHLEFLDATGVDDFLDQLRAQAPDCVLVGGDIGQAPTLCEYLLQLENAVQCPVYFVLGNHDYYRGSIVGLRATVTELQRQSRFLHWLNLAGVVPLTETTGLVGHDAWGDGRLGDYANSRVFLNDFRFIEELCGLLGDDLLHTLHDLGDEAARHFEAVLPEALAAYRHVVVLTHVPPFRAASWHEGRPSGDDWLPFFACKATGDVLKEVMRSHPDRRMTVLCGHTHGEGHVQVLPNLDVYTGGACYGAPEIQHVFDWD